MVLMGMRKSEGKYAPGRLHVSGGVGWRMNERKMSAVEDA